MRPEMEYRECLRCEYIEDCPQPFVDLQGKAKPPRVCWHPDDIILTRREKVLNGNI
jgi:hypothetical protein